MIAHQLSPALQAFILHHKDNLTLIEILGVPFCEMPKEFQAEYYRISAIYQVLKRQEGFGSYQLVMESTPANPTQSMGPKAVDGQWVW